jgi:hypothetical protein
MNYLFLTMLSPFPPHRPSARGNYCRRCVTFVYGDIPRLSEICLTTSWDGSGSIWFMRCNLAGSRVLIQSAHSEYYAFGIVYMLTLEPNRHHVDLYVS